MITPGLTKMEFSLYVDETGKFSGGGEFGVRLVFGVMLQGSPASHSRHVYQTLRDAVDWWPGDLHATELSKPFLIWRAFSRISFPPGHPSAELQARIPPNLSFEELRFRDARLHRELSHEAQRLYRAALAAVGACCWNHGGEFVVVAEHNTNPEKSRYPDMVQALVEATAIRAALRGATELQVFLENGGAGGPPENATLRGSVEEIGLNLRASHGVELRSLRTVTLAQEPCLALADFAAHWVGSKGKQDKPLQPGSPLGWNTNMVQSKISQNIGKQIPLTVVGAMETRDLLHQVLENKISRESAMHTLVQWQRQLPAGMLGAVVEGTKSLLAQLA